MKDGALRARVARIHELSGLDALMELAIGELLEPFLTAGLLAHYWLDGRIWSARARLLAAR